MSRQFADMALLGIFYKAYNLYYRAIICDAFKECKKDK